MTNRLCQGPPTERHLMTLTPSGAGVAFDGGTSAHHSGNPRPVITGVTPPLKLSQTRTYETHDGGSASFDWYASTVLTDPDSLLSALADNLGADVREGKPLHGYTQGYELVTAEGVAARVLAGGANGAPHAWASGADASAYVDVVRALWPTEHRVSRVDSRIDFGGTGDGEEIWNALYAACKAMASERPKPLKTSLAGDYIGKTDGRTLYVGSKKSGVFVRLYEKGKQLRRSMRDQTEAANIPADWVRLEIQVRPDGDRRWDFAHISADGAWGASEWSRDLAHELAGLDVPRISMQHKRETDDERALAWVARQYGGTFERIAEEHGWPAVWERLAAAVHKSRAGVLDSAQP